MTAFDTFEFLSSDTDRKAWLHIAIRSWSDEREPKIRVEPFGAFLQAREHLGDLVQRLLIYIKEKYSVEQADEVYKNLDLDLQSYIAEERPVFQPSPAELVTAVTIACTNRMKGILAPLKQIVSSRNKLRNAERELKSACSMVLKSGYSGSEIFQFADTVLTTNFGARNADLVPAALDTVVRTISTQSERPRIEVIRSYVKTVVGRLRAYVNTTLNDYADSEPDMANRKKRVLKLIFDKNVDDKTLWEAVDGMIGGFGSMERISNGWFPEGEESDLESETNRRMKKSKA